jgi:hypothetical protein
MGTPLSRESLRWGELQMDWLRSEDLKEEKVVTTPSVIIARGMESVGLGGDPYEADCTKSLTVELG